ncbi:AMP-binding protein [Streptomyces sp. NPDC090022]|uniref:AMP-binding protein n=1 Tax=Streptomyces sp. NPDC090022 TaxID=3365920 RepID=UPI00380E91F9
MALFLLSGATTAERPLLVPRTHNDYAYQARAAAAAVSLTEDDVYLVGPSAESPFAVGRPGAVGTLSVGGTVVLPDAPGAAAHLALVERERVTLTSLEPATAGLWLDAFPAVRADMSSLRLVQLGGAPPDRVTAARIGATWGCRLQQDVGMAEGLVTLTAPVGPDASELSTHGRPLSPDDEIRIVGPGGEDVPEGERGELLVRGPYTLRGYYRAPVPDTGSFSDDGYFRTGVLARRTPDGDLVMTGRLTERA